jgi:hypothetical protein
MTSEADRMKFAALRQERDALLEYVEKQLVGPAGGEDELISTKDDRYEADKPFERYLMGMLFPIGAGVADPDRNEEAADTGTGDDPDDPVSLAYQARPSSMGLSFFTRSTSVEVSIHGATYIREGRGYRRSAFASKECPMVHAVTSDCPEVADPGVAGLRIGSKWRKSGGGWLVTVVVSNSNRADQHGRYPVEDVFMQMGLCCRPSGSGVEAYPSPDRYSWDVEEEELALSYRDRKTFAIGHGVSARWMVPAADSVESIETCFLPRYEVPDVTAEFDEHHPLNGSRVFSLQYLADSGVPKEEKISALREFHAAYASWVEEQRAAIPGLERFGNAATRLVGRMDDALRRIGKGIRLLETDVSALECFRMANLAMLKQMVHGSADYSGTARPAGRAFTAPDYFAKEWSGRKWRPFQIAFQLMVIESLVNANSVDRETVDLIWFPTGGGKTEAYLALAAFELFHRRRVSGDKGGGTAVIKRYTLRLLTAQQFERAASLICACDMLRSENPRLYGNEPFTLGLWVGQDTTPNTFQKANTQYREMIGQERPENPFQLRKCPWCGTRIVPERRSDVQHYGISCDDSRFAFYCPEATCPFHASLPVNVVDDHLYANPPSLLVATIDKFARLAWEPRAASFFKGAGNERLPPSLVIQDELHLISGPLGTVAGLYEAALDVLMERFGAKPKYIAATATIRRSYEQVLRLYARGAAVFPPAGLMAGDSFFSREVREKPGRLYAGVLGQSHSPVTAFIHASAAFAQAPMEVGLSADVKDAYWTQVIYHNSKRELGAVMNHCRDDIPDRIGVIASAEELRRRDFEPVEMSANIPSREIPAVLEQLKVKFGETNVVNALPCTNMFSVGVDIGRLGLIMMNGQPKTTSEYIQASSRVGRSAVPGIVVAFYPANKARDRSHYESFIPYHQALYRAVEPTSVTPYSQPAMERALHAALVIVMRYCGGLETESSAGRFDPGDPQQQGVIGMLRVRMKAAQRGDDRLCDGIDRYLDACVSGWRNAVNAHRTQLRYDTRGAANYVRLLAPYEPGMYWRPQTPWPTLNSMRDVDEECNVFVIFEDR